MTRADRRRFLRTAGIAVPALGLPPLVAASTIGPVPAPAAAKGTGIGRSALDFGADASGRTDSTAALQRAVDESGDGLLLIPRGRYRVQKPLRVRRAGVVIAGESCRSERATGSVLFKGDGFRGEALLHVGDDDAGLSGFSLSGLTLDGAGQAGSGLLLRRVGNAVLDAVVVDRHTDWGLVVDGGFLCSLRGIVAIRNGHYDNGRASGGGILFSADSRECADCRLFDSYANKNRGWQLRLARGRGRKDRVVGLTVWGCQFERADHQDERVPVVGIDATDRSSFFGCNLVQPKGQHAPCLQLGTAGSSVDDVSFIACCLQYNGRLAALRALAGTRGVSFHDLRHYGRGPLFDLDPAIEPGALYFSRPVDLTRGRGAAAISFPLLQHGGADGG